MKPVSRRPEWMIPMLFSVATLSAPTALTDEAPPTPPVSPTERPDQSGHSSADTPDSTLSLLAAPLLADWIIQSREEAIMQGVDPIPDAIRAAITGYVPEDILDRVRWRVGGGGDFSLQANSFYFADTPAITLDYVVVFRDSEDALHDVELWLHELRHVIQFRDWGIEGFAARYLDNSTAVESDASRYRWGWVFGSR